jgi:hypothetical protein
MQRPVWFKKNNSFGWAPATWQGWFILIAYLIAIVRLMTKMQVDFENVDPINSFVLPAIILTVILLIVSRLTIERAKKSE